MDSASSAIFEDTHITNNEEGVDIVQMSRLAFYGGSITSNGFGIYLDLHSTAEVSEGAQIMDNAENNISVNTDSGVLLGETETVYLVDCDGPESSVRPLSNVMSTTVPGTTDCTDF